MNTTRQDWEDKLNNLHTRTKGISSEHQINYKSLLKKVFIGPSVLDVGCGTCWLKDYLPKQTFYTGLDACLHGPEIINTSIEDFFDHAEDLKHKRFDTLFVFAAMDGMMDLNKAIQNMKKITRQNIVILTGINIEPDQYHTHKITEEYIDEQMDGFRKSYRFQVHPKIIFLEYTKL
jgi:SAM-dependent methyltransferase